MVRRSGKTANGNRHHNFFGCLCHWLAMKVRNRVKESDEAVLANAWRVVLSDPNYKQRRPLEERKHAVEGDALALGEAARETSQS
jgi:hypothetical protein